MPGLYAAIGAALKLPSDSGIQDCQTEPAADIRVSLMRRPAAPDGAGSRPRASGFRKKERIEVLSPDPYSLLSGLYFPNPDSEIPNPLFHSITHALRHFRLVPPPLSWSLHFLSLVTGH
jgi:hypothetical protein